MIRSTTLCALVGFSAGMGTMTSTQRRGGGQSAGNNAYAEVSEAFTLALEAIDCVPAQCSESELQAVNDAVAAHDVGLEAALQAYNDVYSYEVGCDVEKCCEYGTFPDHSYGVNYGQCDFECCVEDMGWSYFWVTTVDSVNSYAYSDPMTTYADLIEAAAAMSVSDCDSTCPGYFANGNPNTCSYAKCENCDFCAAEPTPAPRCDAFCGNEMWGTGDNAYAPTDAQRCGSPACAGCGFCDEAAAPPAGDCDDICTRYFANNNPNTCTYGKCSGCEQCA